MNKLYLLIALFLASLQAQAQIMVGADNAADYLMITTEQQEIYLKRYLNANKEIAIQCQPGWTLDQSNQFFIVWLNNHPQYLRRNLTSAFSAALLESCKIEVKK